MKKILNNIIKSKINFLSFYTEEILQNNLNANIFETFDVTFSK